MVYTYEPDHEVEQLAGTLHSFCQKATGWPQHVRLAVGVGYIYICIYLYLFVHRFLRSFNDLYIMRSTTLNRQWSHVVYNTGGCIRGLHMRS